MADEIEVEHQFSPGTDKPFKSAIHDRKANRSWSGESSDDYAKADTQAIRGFLKDRRTKEYWNG